MFRADKPLTFDTVARLALAAALIWGAVNVLDYLSDALLPFVLAVVLAYFTDPLVRLVQRVVHQRGAAVLCTLAALLAVLVGVVWVVAPMVAREAAHLAQLLAGLVNGSDLAQQAAKRLPPDIWRFLQDFAQREDLRQFLSSTGAGGLLETVAQKILPGVWGVLAGARDVIFALFGLLVVALYTVFVLIDFESLRRGAVRLIPERYRQGTVSFFDEFAGAMNRYFRAQALVALLVGILFAIGFSLVGLPLAVPLGLFVGLLNMVPYLQLVALPPALLLGVIRALESGSGFLTVLALVLVVFAVVQLIQDTVLTPRIMGGAMGMSPAIMLLSLSVWGKLLGFLGLVIALPLSILTLSWYRRLVTADDGPEGEIPPGDAIPAGEQSPNAHASGEPHSGEEDEMPPSP